jgi:hypothetical protein
MVFCTFPAPLELEAFKHGLLVRTRRARQARGFLANLHS